CSSCACDCVLVFIFFFQAEDGIRAFHVTGVQTCALPISCSASGCGRSRATIARGIPHLSRSGRCRKLASSWDWSPQRSRSPPAEIGRASCKEKVQIDAEERTYKKKPTSIDQRRSEK